MDFAEWEPYYTKILGEFGYQREKDEQSAKLLDSSVVQGAIIAPDTIRSLDWSNVIVVGGAATLHQEFQNKKMDGLVISAGPATSMLLSFGILPTLFVTDLDGPVDDEIEANMRGSIGVVHAHGDNMDLISAYAPRFNKIILSTQSKPFGRVHNFGGFTDGDRAVMLARHFGAKKISLIGFDFVKPSVKIGSDLSLKKMKLRCAKKLIFELNPSDVVIHMF